MSSSAQQAADELRWWLRLPPTNLIARQDHIRFRHATYLMIHQIAAVLYEVNGLPDQMYFPSQLSGAQPAFDGLINAPVHAGSRLAELACTADETRTWQQAQSLINETLNLSGAGSDEPLQSAVSPSLPHQMASRAEAIAVHLQWLDGVEAVMLGGSLARGVADDQSDIDMHVFCQALPPEDMRRKMLASWPDIQQVPLIEHACDTVWLDSVLVHIRYWCIEEVDRLFRLPSPPYQMILLAEELQNGHPLIDPGDRIRLWQQMVDHPPRAMVETTIDQARQRLASFRVMWLKACSWPDPIHQYCLINQAVHGWLVVLYICNDRFLSTPRWTHLDLSNLPRKPDNLYNRLAMLVDAIGDAAEAETRFSRLEILWEELPGM